MAWLFALLLAAGGIPAAVLSEVMRSDSPRILRAARIAFAFLLAFDLLLAATFFMIGQEVAFAHMSRSLWWATIILGGVPLALVSGWGVRRGYTGHRLALATATLTTAALYVVFPLGFIPDTRPKLTGLGRFEHDHHVLDVAVLLIPTLILLASELSRRREPASESAADDEGVRFSLADIPPSYLIGTAIAVVLVIWLALTNGAGQLLGVGVLCVGGALWIWRRNRAEVRRVVRDLGSPENRDRAPSGER